MDSTTSHCTNLHVIAFNVGAMFCTVGHLQIFESMLIIACLGLQAQ